MGLAGAKNKKKWAKDPNNNAWSRNTDTFGQKIMRSQGWAPGDYLGAKDASHSEYYGAANASHIRAVLKDDNMGLGAKRNQGDECVGLDAFQELLGRLNGKSEESLDEARKKREEAKVNKYLHRKLGTVRFVFAGYLVGDKVQALADELKREKEAENSKNTAEGKKEKKSKKRKAEVEDDTSPEEQKSKKSKSQEADDDSKAKRREKKEKKRKERALKDESNDSNAEPEESKTDETSEDASSRKKSKKDKKEKRNKSKIAEEADASDNLSKKKRKRKAEKDDEASSVDSSVVSTPIASGNATPIPHRHLARQRFIAQKRAAVMDQAALNQIFMIKT
ncbi:telomerase inhibitor [Gnomoniopsis smithogilvyi]|uniref:PinX1-related protein 1 n=1 Tax=Gnomoniopsis smithogilvyi TaxID=1191159 RepID=A0A9W8Z3H6_9PEZI|nr:telomerase inhibitor [Gnomoniopsis smithogilvyi]